MAIKGPTFHAMEATMTQSEMFQYFMEAVWEGHIPDAPRDAHYVLATMRARANGGANEGDSLEGFTFPDGSQIMITPTGDGFSEI
jgi:hypothetical protein